MNDVMTTTDCDALSAAPDLYYANSQILDTLNERFRIQLINSLSGFKSANLIGTASSSGVLNLAVVSSVVHIGAHPPLLGMVTRPRSARRDTVDNIEATGHYTINHIHNDIYPKAHQTSARYNADINEFEKVGLTPVTGNLFSAPYVGEATIRIGMQLEEIKHLDINNTDFIIGRVIELSLPSQLIGEDGYVDICAANSVAISSLDSYHCVSPPDRLGYAKPGTPEER